MSPFERAKTEAIEALRAALPDAGDFDIGLLETPPERAMGDIAFPCFGLAKMLKKAPPAIAEELASAFVPRGLLGRAEAAGPYVNFFFDRSAFSRAVLEDQTKTPGKLRELVARTAHLFLPRRAGAPERVMVEYAQPNTHKDLHVGHLRNVVLGAAVIRLMRAAGHDVVPVSYINDAGAAVAKCLWAYKKFHDGEEPEGVEERGKFLGETYAEADRKIAENEALKDEVAEVLRKFEAGDKETVALWRRTRQWSLDLFEKAFGELGAPIEKYYYESDVVQDGRKVVEGLVKKGIARVSEGATIVDLDDKDLGVLVVLKTDGTTLYSTADLALATKKYAEYPDIARSIHVVDVRQALYFKQIFETFRRMGFDKTMVHLAYEFVTLKEGAMSSRKGTVVRYGAFRDEMVRRATEETAKRHEDWDAKKIAKTAHDIAFGAMLYGMLKIDTERQIVFDIEEALSFEGFTGPYIQYAHTRLASILAKAGKRGSAKAGEYSEDEYAPLRLLAELPLVIRAAAEQSRPSVLAQYLFDLAKASNDFYRDVPVIAADEADKARRLAVVRALKTGLANGLALLGMAAPEVM